MSKITSIFSALLCTLIWGTTFIAQETGMEFIGPYAFNGIRFFVGFLALVPFYFLIEKKKSINEISKNKSKFFFYSVLIGFFLFLGSVFQQVALIYTDVANAAFFTIFYVPMVPIILFFFYSKSIHWSIWPSSLFCIVGVYLLSDFSNATVRLGDSLVILCALFWALHIIFIGNFIKTFNLPLFFGALQALVVSFFSLIVILESILDRRFTNICTKKYFHCSCSNHIFLRRGFCSYCSMDYFKSNFRSK